jgi:hypothetical protein
MIPMRMTAAEYGMIPMRMALLVTGITLTLAVESSQAADDCLAGPNAPAPQGNHWYYRVERATHRECWYLGAEGREVRVPAHQNGSSAPSHPSNTIRVQPASETSTEANPAQDAGAGRVAAKPVPVEIMPSPARTAEAAETRPLAAEPVPIDITTSQGRTVTGAAPLGAELVPVEVKPSEAKTAKNSTASAIRRSAVPTSNLSIDRTLVSTRDSYAEEHSMTHSENEMKLAKLSAARRLSEIATLTAVLAIWLGLAALIARTLFRP